MSSSNNEIILYDLPSKDPCRCWSLNPWKTRLLLNYLKTPYRTHWLEYPDVAPYLKGLGLPPNPEGSPAAYSIPAVSLPDGTHVMDSLPIAQALLKLHPAPELEVDSPDVAKVQQALMSAMPHLSPIYIPSVPETYLNPPSEEYFRRTREERFGKPLGELRKDGGEGGREAWGKGKEGLGKVAEVYRSWRREEQEVKGEEGPFLGGGQVTYADFVVAAWVRMFDGLGRSGEVREFGGEEIWGVYEGVKERGWFEREGH